MVQNRQSVRHISDRCLRAAANFLKFSPTLMQLRLLPGWVFLSLAINGFLFAVVVGFLVRHLSVSNPSFASASAGSATETIDSINQDLANRDLANRDLDDRSESQTHLITASSSDTASLSSASGASSSDSSLGPRHQLNYQQWRELLAQEAKVAAEQQPKRLTILAGDSISLWFPEELLPAERSWLNQGISGETSTGLSNRLDLFSKTTPEAVFIMIGINDLLRGTDDQVVLDNQQQIVRSLKEAHPYAQIIVQSILPHAADKATWEGRDRLADLPNSRIRKLNHDLEAIAQDEGVYFLDLYSLFADAQGNLRMDLSTDGLHLNAQGYQVWGVALQVYSREVLEPDMALTEPADISGLD